MTSTPDVLYSQSGAVVQLILSNPSARNALTPGMLSNLALYVRDADSHNDVRVIVIRGEGSVFSSGYSLSSFPDPSELMEEDELSRATDAISGCSTPTIALLNGDAIGAAFDVALSADFRVAAETARLGITPARFGLVYSWQGIDRLVRVLGERTARRLLMTGEFVSAARACELGAVDEVAEGDGLDAVLARWSETLASVAPLSVAGTKHVLRTLAARGLPSAEERADILAMRRAALGSSDVAEAVTAFRERRRPVFLGA